jgi:hypothetical protein
VTRHLPADQRELVLALARLHHWWWKQYHPKEEFPDGQYWWRSTATYVELSAVIHDARTRLEERRDFLQPMKKLRQEYTECVKKLAKANRLFIEHGDAVAVAIDLLTGHFRRNQSMTFATRAAITKSYMTDPHMEYLPCNAIKHQFLDHIRELGYSEVLDEEHDENEWEVERPTDPLKEAQWSLLESEERPKWEAMLKTALQKIPITDQTLFNKYEPWAYGARGKTNNESMSSSERSRLADDLREARSRYLKAVTKLWCANRKPCDFARAILGLEENQELTPWLRYLDRSSRRVWEEKLRAVAGNLEMIGHTGKPVNSPCAQVIHYACDAPLYLPAPPPDCGPPQKTRRRLN